MNNEWWMMNYELWIMSSWKLNLTIVVEQSWKKNQLQNQSLLYNFIDLPGIVSEDVLLSKQTMGTWQLLKCCFVMLTGYTSQSNPIFRKHINVNIFNLSTSKTYFVYSNSNFHSIGVYQCRIVVD